MSSRDRARLEQRLLTELASLGGDCLQHDPELWFADERHVADQNVAKRICSSCPALARCQSLILDFELETNWVQYGIYGGLGEKERRKYLTQQQNRRGA